MKIKDNISSLKSPKWSFIERKSSNRTSYEYSFKDSSPVIVSTDRDEALDLLYAMMRGEHSPDVGETNESIVDDVATCDSLTATAEVDSAE